jgi:hypothetical protein
VKSKIASSRFIQLSTDLRVEQFVDIRYLGQSYFKTTPFATFTYSTPHLSHPQEPLNFRTLPQTKIHIDKSICLQSSQHYWEFELIWFVNEIAHTPFNLKQGCFTRQCLVGTDWRLADTFGEEWNYLFGNDNEIGISWNPREITISANYCLWWLFFCAWWTALRLRHFLPRVFFHLFLTWRNSIIFIHRWKELRSLLF